MTDTREGPNKLNTTRRTLTRAIALVALTATSAFAQLAPFRPPAVPLITHDPYFSCWSMSDRLADGWPKHWTEKTMGLSGIVRIDGVPLRFLGGYPGVQTMEQTSLEVTATRSIYTFDSRGLKLTVTFCSPLLMDDLDVMSRPATYVTFEASSTDGVKHAVEVLFEASGEFAVDTPATPVVSQRLKADTLSVVSMSAADQKVLTRSGDDLRIEWGRLLLAAPTDALHSTFALAEDLRQHFMNDGTLPNEGTATDGPTAPRRADDGWPVLAIVLDFGKVDATPSAQHLIVAYDDAFALQYFKKNVRAWWRRDPAMTAEAMLTKAEVEYGSIYQRCVALDKQIFDEAKQSGGEKFARLCALAYRHTIAAHKLAADENGEPIFISKENSSNGCADTVDVMYPSAPFFLLYKPQLLQAQLAPIFRYAESGEWKFDFGPHDMGTYPLVNGNVYGDNKLEFQMPIEESGNLLILTAALAKAEHNADFAKAHWATLTKWTDYLVTNGLDPVNQLCTADMFGHLAHNADLSLKAIIGIGGYAQLCETLGKKDDAAKYGKIAKDYANKWQEMAGAAETAGGPTRLAFDKPGSWAMKHNLVWDRVLGTKLFPKSVGDREVAQYLKVQNAFGLPCDNRTPTTLLDWDVWCAALASDPKDFEAMIDPLYRASNETNNRVPMTDWFNTTNAVNSGFRARSVVGGIYMKQLVDKWAK